MILRYSREKMRNIWTEESKFDSYLKVEILACEAWSKLNIIPVDDVLKIKEKAKISIKRIKEIEEETKHDVIAFTRSVSECLGEEKKWIHYGLTSTDVVDTSNAYLIKKANDIIYDDLLDFIKVLKLKALKYKNTPCIGRTHGIHAEITSFGLKWVLWYEEMMRNLKRFESARFDIECGKISGAVGNYVNVDPFVEKYVCENLGISCANISTQIIQRDRYAYYISILSLIASSLEKIATEIRSLQRIEIHEVDEYFSKNQKGSSAMPHKKNPISSENICGCARLMRGYMIPAFEDIALWHERDISHSSVERILLPDATELIDYMLNRFKGVLENLIVYEDNMLKNIYKTNGAIFSQRVMMRLIEKGLSREEAYDKIQRLALISYNENKDFKKLVLDSDVSNILNNEEIESSFTLDYYFKKIDYIYEKCNIK
ncbi:MAG: adenylosuccinate lyase [Acholeplasmatales bacterium]|nr:adenylosuccinate lyase [Acholeplasmatales bacterium]